MTDKEKDTAQNGAETPQRAAIIDDSEYRPELDPGSPEFDPKQYAEAIEAAGGMKKMTADIADSLHRIGEIVGENLAINQADLLTDFAEAALDSMKTARDAQLDAIQERTDTLMGISKAAVEDMERIKGPILNAAHEQMKAAPDAIHEAVENLLSGGEEARRLIEAFALSDAFKEMVSALKRLGELIGEQRDALQAAQSRGPEIQSLFPYLLEEFEQVRKEGKGYFDGMTNAGIFEAGYDENGNPTNSLFSQILEKARKHKREDEAADPEEEAEKLTSAPVYSILYPLDKVNNTIWRLLDSQWDNGYTKLYINTADESERQKGKKAIIDFEMNLNAALSQANVDIKLDEYDKRVFIAYYSLLRSGNVGFSASQIYAEMGQRSNAPAEEIAKINASLNKMRAGTLTISNESEVELHKDTPRYSVIDSSFLPFVRKRTYINNIICEDTIVPLMMPPLGTFFEQRGQFLPLSREALQSPVNKTPGNLAIEHYLLGRIGPMKNKKRRNVIHKILFSTVFENCQISDRRYKARAKETVYKLLDNYIKTGVISGYTKLADGVIIDPGKNII